MSIIKWQFGAAIRCQQSGFTPSTPDTFLPKMQSVKSTSATRSIFVFMTPTPEAHPDSVNARLAHYLTTKIELIIAEWLERVRADPAIVSTESH